MGLLGGLIGESPGLAAVRRQVEQLLRRQSEARRLPPILILGETGTGKGLLARALHEAGPRKAAAFVSVNCAAIPETLLEAELFGYERGAFTDARQAKAGLFQTAHGGTLFLDEIALLPENLQAKLLTALEDRAVRRLGSTRTEPADVWIISATSEDLKAGARRRGFREELYHRLAVMTLRLPPLRERGRDILALAEHFLARTCSDYGLTPKTLAEDARAALLAYRWPGNVRELGNVMERAALLVEGPLVRADSLELATPRGRRTVPQQDRETTPDNATTGVSLGQTVEELERRRIGEALSETGWNISRAATRLGMTRNILRYRVQKYGLRTPPTALELTEPNDDVRDAVEPTTDGRPPKVQWERRHVALLRADLVPATSTVVPAANAPLETLVEKIESFGGLVEEMSPGGLMAVFGLEPIEDAPRRAAHAALAIQRIAARARESSPESPGVRMGLHVGEVLIGRVGSAARVEHAAKHEAWQQLEALMAGAEAGTVLVSETTRPFLERRFVVAPSVADGSATRTVRRLIGIERTGLGLGERLTPFVARSRELDQLARAFEQAKTGHGQVVTVVGEPGVGKSRLLWEFLESNRGPGALILVSGAASYGEQTAYLPVIDLLKAYFQIAPRDDADKVRQRVTEKVVSGSALAPVLPALLAVLDVPAADAQWQRLDPRQKRRRTMEAVKLLLLEESGHQPLVLVLEDLHWLDSESQAVLDMLVESLPSHRVLLLVSYRPEYQHAWGGKTYYAQLRLDPLSPEDAHALLDHLLGSDEATAALKTVLIGHTEGNPFFLEEGVRTLVETGALAGDRGAYRLARPAEEIGVPATVQAVLAARIDRLPPEEKALLHVAAVIGKDVPLALLQAVADMPEDSLHASLMRLQNSEFLYETRLLPEVEYAFKHALSHEVAYAGLLQDRRRVLHARIMAAIEQLHSNRLIEQVDRLAHHALQGEVWDKAAAYGRQAGEKAAARSAYREAVARFEQALEALTHLPETRETIEQDIDLRLDLRDSLSPLGERRRSFDHLRAGEVLAERIGDQDRIGWISAYTSNHFWEAGDPDRAVQYAQRALAVAQARGDLRLKVVSSQFLGMAHLSLGDFRRAREGFESNIQSLEGDLMRERMGGMGLGLPSVRTRVWLVHVLADCGNFAEGITRGREAVEIAETGGQPLDVIAAYRGLGYLYLRKGDLDEAMRFLERSRELSQVWKIPGWIPGIFVYLGYAHVLSGRLDDGLSLIEQGIERRPFLGASSGYAWSLASLGEAYGLANREEDALRTVRQALDFARGFHRRPHEAWALRALGEIASRRDPPDTEKAEAAYRQAMALAEELGMRPTVAHCHHGLGDLFQRVGKRGEAHEHLAAAATMYREMEMRFWLDRVETAASRL